jgi:hypothetical protein
MRRVRLARLLLRLIVTSGESGVITRIPGRRINEERGLDPAEPSRGDADSFRRPLSERAVTLDQREVGEAVISLLIAILLLVFLGVAVWGALHL